MESAPSQQDKISAYYSLVFPSITYYLQTLNVTIGRRCIPANSPSSSAALPQVDVDLGPLKSVSRLHANIEYDETEERFVLVVQGRNGAWVDGVWSGSGSRVPLNERSQIQIASRTFHFVLPPPPPITVAPLEDSPSPATSHESSRRGRSPSVDITSISPDSSIPSCSPPPPVPQLIPEIPQEKPPEIKREPKPDPVVVPQHPLPSTSGKMRTQVTAATVPKKRKKPELDVPVVKPEIMPPKPPLTYAQMCHRAIKSLGGKATLQDIIGWMIDNFDWYKYNVGSGWESSVRHNLSSGKAFKKMERSTGERGKGYYWSIDENFEHVILEQDLKLQNSQSAALGKDGKNKKSKGPLPPPLTSAPLAMKSIVSGSSMSTFRAHPPPLSSPFTTSVKMEPQTMQSLPPQTSTFIISPATQMAAVKLDSISAPQPPAPSAPAAIPATVRIPIIVGPVPESHVPSSSTELSSSASAHLPTPPIVLHENTLILNPTIFGHLTADQLKGLEALGAQKALEILQGYIVRFLKERIRTEGGRGRGRGRGRGARGGGVGRGKGDPTQQKATDVKPEATPVQPEAVASAPPPAPDHDANVVIDILGDGADDERASKRRKLDVPDLPPGRDPIS